MSEPTPPGEPEPGRTPPPPPGWGPPPPEQTHGPADSQVPYPPPQGPPSGGPPEPNPDPGRSDPYGQQYGQPYGQQYPPPQHDPSQAWYPTGPVTNQKAQWALAIGLLAIPLACCSAVLGLVGIVAIVLGVQARREIAAGRGQETGEGLATAGIVAGGSATLIAVLLSLLLVMVFVFGEVLVTTS
jgi:hypothetical protein